MLKIDERILLTKTFDVHQDWTVPIPSFFIVASRDDSKKSFADFDDEEITELGNTLKKVRTAMRDTLNIENVYIFQNEDTDHGFHIWMFPRYDWMNTIGTKIQSVRPIIEYAKDNMNTKETLSEIHNVSDKMRVALSNN
jgi:diadenosine tetraphosphate (Ap4A) HIT family hydrolase